MTEHVRLIWKKLDHLQLMEGYLSWSLVQVGQIVPIRDWAAIAPEQHESLAAFRVRFGEFQEHLGKTMRAIAIEEEENPEPFGAVLAYDPFTHKRADLESDSPPDVVVEKIEFLPKTDYLILVHSWPDGKPKEPLSHE